MRKIKFVEGRIPSYYILNKDLCDGKHIYYDAVIYCDRYRCIFDQKAMEIFGCTTWVRAHFADLLVYDGKNVDLRPIRELCRRYENGLRCLRIVGAEGLKRSGIYVCLDDVIRLLMNAVRPKPVESVLRQIEWGLPLALAQIKGLSNKDREELQFLVYEIIIEKIIPWLEKKGVLEHIQ